MASGRFVCTFVVALTVLACDAPESRSMQEPSTREHERARMVHEQLRARDIHDQRVLDVMGRVPRHQFVPESHRAAAYEDHPLPIGHDQTISQPYIVAFMTQALKVQ